MNLAMAWLQAYPDENDHVTMEAVIRALPSSPHIPEAIGELEKTIEANPDCYWAHEALSVIYRYQGNESMSAFHEYQVKSILQKLGK